MGGNGRVSGGENGAESVLTFFALRHPDKSAEPRPPPRPGVTDRMPERGRVDAPLSYGVAGPHFCTWRRLQKRGMSRGCGSLRIQSRERGLTMIRCCE